MASIWASTSLRFEGCCLFKNDLHVEYRWSSTPEEFMRYIRLVFPAKNVHEAADIHSCFKRSIIYFNVQTVDSVDPDSSIWYSWSGNFNQGSTPIIRMISSLIAAVDVQHRTTCCIELGDFPIRLATSLTPRPCFLSSPTMKSRITICRSLIIKISMRFKIAFWYYSNQNYGVKKKILNR